MFQKVAVHTRQSLEAAVNFVGILKELELCSREIFLTLEAQAHTKKQYPVVDFSNTHDILVVVGGDGSILSVVRKMKNFSTPLLPISAGTLGFLAEIPPQDFSKVCQRVLRGECTADKRSLLDVWLISKNGERQFFRALNDAVISKSSVARVISLQTKIDGEPLTRYRADGLIIATPTGSTAYSLSAGGPIVYPRFEAIILTPICPHSLSHRSLVIPGEKTIGVMTDEENREDPVLTLDGQMQLPLEKGSHVEIKMSTEKLTFLRLPEEHFFKTIKRKMHWGEGGYDY